MSADIVGATHEYEDWVRARIALIEGDLELKHREMADSAFRFLRGTYYWWLLRFSEQVPELLDRPTVPMVGDLHVENFGTWRDHRGAQRWGINDLDELAWGSPAIDLVRLLTSVSLIDGLSVSVKALSRLIVDVWSSANPGAATLLKAAPHLRSLVPAPKSTSRFYAALESGEGTSEIPARVETALQHSVRAPKWQPTWHHRSAGTGSLGHQRFVAVGRDARKVWHAREAKELGPAAAEWLADRAHLPVPDDLLYGRVESSVRGPYPSRRVAGWQIRRLAPDAVRIELAGLRKRDIERVIISMVRAVVDVHGVERDALVAARKRGITASELRDAVELMRADTLTSHEAWRASLPH